MKKRHKKLLKAKKAWRHQNTTWWQRDQLAYAWMVQAWKKKDVICS